MHVQRNTEARSRNHCRRGKAINTVLLILSVYVSVVIQHTMSLLHIVSPVWLYHTFPHYLINA